MPPMTSMVSISSATHIVTDMFGSSIMSAHITTPTAIRGNTPLIVVIFLLFLDIYAAANMTYPTLATSLDCSVMTPRLSQRRAP